MKLNNEQFNILREISKNPSKSQRELAKQFNLSLGKVNYCLKALKEKGIIKIQNFKKNQNKLNYLYILTPLGIAEKTNLTIQFMRKKIQEYDELKKEKEELDKLNSNRKKNLNVDHN